MKERTMAGAWIGFAGSLIGSALAALIAVFVMNRTNKANKRIASKSARADFSNQLISITADYCGLLEQAHLSLIHI